MTGPRREQRLRERAYRRVYESRYELFIPPADASWWPCFYCGEPADSTDHCPPLSRIHGYEAFELEHPKYVKVRCCRECNSLLGDSLQYDLIDRWHEVRRLLERRYEKLIRIPDWSATELAGLAPRLRKQIQGALVLRDDLERRLNYGQGLNAWLLDVELHDEEAA